ncbi:zinc-binding dehydrogenase [Pseudooceanicola sp. GBMRC 2024]|uniref:Zinc-binding dehydrogenase n=1 Tax=Pseudooceanicola albus TaxID=2692189 RepID=A0A6L7G1B7_9RHOB|nr:NADP-dependent oxidoreductase [Pseudooceanicola albus]MXN17845.1 zinc-binding dehydrogenase [Pseudooceanicola albus]
MTQMTAIQLTAFGGPETLRPARIDLPVPGPGQLLIRQVASSVNPVDLMIRRGGYPRVGPQDLPYVGGRDVAGHVVSLGAGVDPAWVGRAVWGHPGFERGAFADYIVLELSELSPAPQRLPLEDAGCVPLAALTAWQGLHRHGGIRAGETVLIHGGSGGVGHFAVQMARAAGARVIATASERNRALLEDLGADQVVAYDTEAFDAQLSGVDLVLDLIGGQTQARSWAVLKRGGRMISAVAPPDADQIAAHDAEGSRFFIAEPDAGDLETLAGLFDDGTLRVVISAWYPLAETAEAQRVLERGGLPGKIGLRI